MIIRLKKRCGYFVGFAKYSEKKRGIRNIKVEGIIIEIRLYQTEKERG